MIYLKFFFYCFVATVLYGSAFAQEPGTTAAFQDEVSSAGPDSTAKVKVVSIDVTGNKRTKTYIILREIRFKTGDSLIIGQLADIL